MRKIRLEPRQVLITAERARNWARGYRFYWRKGTMECSPGTCPYPVRRDWSAKACIKAGDCGCDERDKK